MDSVVMTGYGVKVHTVDGVLILEHGEPGAREELRLSRSQRRVRHLVLAGRTGYVTLAALRWCRGVGMTVTVIDDEGRPQLVSTDGAWMNGTVRRLQARSDGLEVCRYLMRRKLTEQLATLRTLPEKPKRRRLDVSPLAGATNAEQLEECVRQVDGAETLKELGHIESVAGRSYWWRLGRVPMGWRNAPSHWEVMGRRHHPPVDAIRRDGYMAITPAQSLINYGYGYLLAEAIQACYVAGLDPAVGYMHCAAVVADRGGQRPEFAFDLMEPVRPVIDRQVLALISSRVFTRPGDAAEGPSGGVHLSASLRRDLILSSSDAVRKTLSSVTDGVVRTLRRSIPTKRSIRVNPTQTLVKAE